ncbi:MAG: hypothetical protein Fur0042_21910 [Cyanophyceae cyanobacterium]
MVAIVNSAGAADGHCPISYTARRPWGRRPAVIVRPGQSQAPDARLKSKVFLNAANAAMARLV